MVTFTGQDPEPSQQDNGEEGKCSCESHTDRKPAAHAGGLGLATTAQREQKGGTVTRTSDSTLTAHKESALAQDLA